MLEISVYPCPGTWHATSLLELNARSWRTDHIQHTSCSVEIVPALELTRTFWETNYLRLGWYHVSLLVDIILEISVVSFFPFGRTERHILGGQTT